jgi:acetyl-CoA acetyltransferase
MGMSRLDPGQANPFADVAIAGVYNTSQRRGLARPEDLDGLAVEVALGTALDAGVPLEAIDGLIANDDPELGQQLRLAPLWRAKMEEGVSSLVLAASALRHGYASHVLITSSPAVGDDAPEGATAPWTRPEAELDSFYGVYTAVQYAMLARRHMHRFGTTPEALATVAATVRNNGARHPLAAMYGRGPYTAEDVLQSRMIADPFHLLDCSIVTSGAAGILMTRAQDARHPVHILGAWSENHGAWFRRRPMGFDRRDDRRPDLVDGWLGEHSAQRAFAMAGLTPADVDVCELYDPFSFEIIRQLEAYGLCPKGEGGDFVLDGAIALDGPCPTNTDGGLLSFSHPGSTVQLLQRTIRGVQQVRGECDELQVAGARVALCGNTSSGGMFGGVILLGPEPSS